MVYGLDQAVFRNRNSKNLEISDLSSFQLNQVPDLSEKIGLSLSL